MASFRFLASLIGFFGFTFDALKRETFQFSLFSLSNRKEISICMKLTLQLNSFEALSLKNNDPGEKKISWDGKL